MPVGPSCLHSDKETFFHRRIPAVSSIRYRRHGRRPDTTGNRETSLRQSLHTLWDIPVDLQPLDNTDGDAMDSLAGQEAPANPHDSPESELSLPFAFMGQGKELFGIIFVNLLKTIFTLGIYRFWAKTRVRQYLWSNTVFSPPGKIFQMRTFRRTA